MKKIISFLMVAILTMSIGFATTYKVDSILPSQEYTINGGSSHAINFINAGTGLTVASDGKVGVGSTTPTSTFEVKGGTNGISDWFSMFNNNDEEIFKLYAGNAEDAIMDLITNDSETNIKFNSGGLSYFNTGSSLLVGSSTGGNKGTFEVYQKGDTAYDGISIAGNDTTSTLRLWMTNDGIRHIGAGINEVIQFDTAGDVELTNSLTTGETIYIGGYTSPNPSTGNYLTSFYNPISEYARIFAYNFTGGVNKDLFIGNFAEKQLYLKGDGKTGMGTDDPQTILDIDGDTGFGDVRVDGATGACLMLRDTDDAGWTKCTTLDGVMSCSIDADGIC